MNHQEHIRDHAQPIEPFAEPDSWDAYQARQHAEREAARHDLESCRPLLYAFLALVAITVSLALYLLEPEPADTTGLPPMVGKGVEL